MSKISDFKKEVKHMVKLFLNECYTQLSFSPEFNQENILDIISDVIVLQRDTVSKLSRKNFAKGSRKNIDYQKVASEFYTQIVELTERLNSLDY